MSGPAAHPDVTWPLSTPSSSGLSLRSRDPRRQTLTTAKSRQTSPPWAVHCCPRNNRAPPAVQVGNSNNGSESTQPEPPAVQLLR
ncbi:hypothetical protein TYRP_020827 [Tyrophagus putrescentiae]|nr:hypothetical protein TYRP_020827 [Tyrophagus putrescentiae]